MNDRLDDHSMDDGLMTDVNLCLRMNGTDDRKKDASRDLRKSDLLGDPNLDGNLVVKNHHVMYY
jgi:hypothetical protein